MNHFGQFIFLYAILISGTMWACALGGTLINEWKKFRGDVDTMGENEAKKAFAQDAARERSGQTSDEAVADFLERRKARRRELDDEQPDLGDECDELVQQAIREG